MVGANGNKAASPLPIGPPAASKASVEPCVATIGGATTAGGATDASGGGGGGAGAGCGSGATGCTGAGAGCGGGRKGCTGTGCWPGKAAGGPPPNGKRICAFGATGTSGSGRAATDAGGRAPKSKPSEGEPLDEVLEVRGTARCVRGCSDTPIAMAAVLCAGGSVRGAPGKEGGSTGEPTGEVLELLKPS